MNVISNIASATRAALLYITVGSLMIVWSAIYWFYGSAHLQNDAWRYWCTGFFLSGITLLVIGLAVGWIGRSARQAEQPHAVVPGSDSKGNPAPNVVPLAGNAVIPANTAPPATLPVNPALQPPVVVQQPVPPTTPRP
jgi:hypothetical protein